MRGRFLSVQPWIAVCAFVLGAVGVFISLHFRSNAWSPTPYIANTDIGRAYWEWIQSNLFSAARTDATRATVEGFQHTMLFLVSLLTWAGGYLAMIRQVASDGERRPAARRVFVIAAVVSLPLLLIPCLLSTDVFSYISYGRIAAIYNHNPYTTTPAEFAGDPAFRWVYWKGVLCVYGPVWLYTSWGSAELAASFDGGVVAHLFVLKGIALVCHFTNGYLISRIATRRATLYTAIYLLNPLLLIEFVGNAHNDGFMITILLLGVLCHRRGRRVGAIALFALAAGTKVWVLPIAGLYCLGWMRESPGHRAALGRGAVSLMVVCSVAAALYLPVWAGAQTFASFASDPSANKLLNSAAELLSDAGASESSARDLFRVVFLAVCALLALRTRSTDDGLRTGAWFALAFCLLGATWYWPWYATTALALTAASGLRLGTRAAVLLSLTSLWIYISFALGFPHGQTWAGVVGGSLHGVRAAVVFGPVAVLLCLALAERMPRVYVWPRLARQAAAHGFVAVRASLGK